MTPGAPLEGAAQHWSRCPAGFGHAFALISVAAALQLDGGASPKPSWRRLSRSRATP